MDYRTPSFPDKIIAGFSYLTAGMVGFIWIIISALRKKYPQTFLLYHIMQSIFLSICYAVINGLFWIIIGILEHIPLLNRLIRQIIYIFNHSILLGYSFIQIILYTIIGYLAIYAFIGKYSYLPGVSKIIMSNLK